MDYFRWDGRFPICASRRPRRRAWVPPGVPPTAVPPCARGGSPGMPRRPRMGHGPRAGVRADRRVAWRRGRPASCWNAGRGSGAGGPRRGREPWLSRDNTPEERRCPRNGAVGRTGVPWRGAPRECERSTPKRATASISRGRGWRAILLRGQAGECPASAFSCTLPRGVECHVDGSYSHHSVNGDGYCPIRV